MSKPIVTYIIAGSTSNLMTTQVLPLLSSLGHTLYATHHNKAGDCADWATYIGVENAFGMAQRGEIERAIWASPTDDVVTVSRFAKLVPTLVISSMSIASHITTGIPTYDKLSAYQLSKLEMALIPDVYNVAPGFYLEDGEEQGEVISPGLHAETTALLLGATGTKVPPAFYEKPAMSVTPKAALARVIARWVANPTETLSRGVFNVFCSNGEYSRMHLRMLALGEYVPAPADKFSSLPHPRGDDGNQLQITDEDVVKTMRSAYHKRQKTAE
jgi:hypothetical protein